MEKETNHVRIHRVQHASKFYDPSIWSIVYSLLDRQPIEHQALNYQGQLHHSSHFRCTSCRSVSIGTQSMNDLCRFRMTLDENAREVRTKLYCSDCYQKLDLPVCSACRRLIDDRVISALGKQWHVEVTRVRRPRTRNKTRMLLCLALLLFKMCTTVSWQ